MRSKFIYHFSNDVFNASHHAIPPFHTHTRVPGGPLSTASRCSTNLLTHLQRIGSFCTVAPACHCRDPSRVSFVLHSTRNNACTKGSWKVVHTEDGRHVPAMAHLLLHTLSPRDPGRSASKSIGVSSPSKGVCRVTPSFVQNIIIRHRCLCSPSPSKSERYAEEFHSPVNDQ